MTINKVTLLGRLGQDPELKYTPNGIAVCSFTLATSEKWSDKNGQKQERTEWHNIIVWGKLGELCDQYLKKGRQIYLEGSNQTRFWDDKNGQKRYKTEVITKTIQFLESNNTNGKNNEKQNAEHDSSFHSEAYINDLNSSLTSEEIPF